MNIPVIQKYLVFFCIFVSHFLRQMVAIGDRVDILWDGDGIFYAATVLSVSEDGKDAIVRYDVDCVEEKEAVWALSPLGAKATCTACGITLEREYLRRASAVAALPVMTVGENGTYLRLRKRREKKPNQESKSVCVCGVCMYVCVNVCLCLCVCV